MVDIRRCCFSGGDAKKSVPSGNLTVKRLALCSHSGENVTAIHPNISHLLNGIRISLH